MEVVVCEAHGTPTRLSCNTCERPICPECMVQTKVGFKCLEHGLTGKVTGLPPADCPLHRGGGRRKE